MKILIVFVTLMGVLRAQSLEEGEELDPTVISHINGKINRILQRFPDVHAPRNEKEAELLGKLEELNATKLEADATEVEEDVVLNAILNFNIYLKHLEQLHLLVEEAESELLTLAGQAKLNAHQSREILQVLHSLRKSVEEGSSDEVIEALKNYETYKIREAYGKDVEEEKEEVEGEEGLDQEEEELEEEEKELEEEEQVLEEEEKELEEEEYKLQGTDSGEEELLEHEEEELEEEEEELEEEEGELKEEEKELEEEAEWESNEEEDLAEDDASEQHYPMLRAHHIVGPLHILHPRNQHIITIASHPNPHHHIVILPFEPSFENENEEIHRAPHHHRYPAEHESKPAPHHYAHAHHQHHPVENEPEISKVLKSEVIHPLQRSRIHPNIIREIVKALKENFEEDLERFDV